MIISEALPNPKGKDVDGEWIELYNNGNEAVNLSGWRLSDSSGKTYVIKDGTVSAGSFFTLDYSKTKISLNNSGDTIILTDNQNQNIDSFVYDKNVADDISVARANNFGKIEHTTTPTKNSSNIITVKKEVTDKNIDNNISVASVENATGNFDITKEIIGNQNAMYVIVIALLIGVIFSVFFMHIYKQIKESFLAEENNAE